MKKCFQSLSLSLIILLTLTSCSIKLYSIEDKEIIVDGIKYVQYCSMIWEFDSTLKDWKLLGYTKGGGGERLYLTKDKHMVATRLSGSIFRVIMTYYLDEDIFCRISQVPTAADIAAVKIFKVESGGIADEIIYESSEISVIQSLFSGEKVEISLDTSDYIANVKVYNVNYNKLYSNASIYYDKIDSVYYIVFRMGDSDFASFQLSNELVSQIFNRHP